mmetsp:Transcript_82892/g.130659  ORF Transcript_82892/g.130659 Transcript_82892/m.130659 type:complete len:232 (-) Transcript_82892:18-713(-)
MFISMISKERLCLLFAALSQIDLTLSAAIVSIVNVPLKEQREACPYWNAIGVLDDHLELLCEDDHTRAFSPLQRESLAMACCPTPYAGCKKSERLHGCDALIAPFIGVSGASISKQEAYERIQKARGALRSGHKNCSVLPEELPHTKCGSETGAAFDRPDLFCEMMLWQSEQLGDGNKEEYETNGCPWSGLLAKAPRRHGGRLAKSELPEWAFSLVAHNQKTFLIRTSGAE